MQFRAFRSLPVYFLPGLVAQLTWSATLLHAATPAFPGAEGAGAYAIGGRGGDVYYVTTLADTGAGSLRTGISTAPATGRTIVFKVSGNIILNSTLTVNRPRITIAGQTAPGDGICVQNRSLNIGANDVIVRHVRTRLGTNGMAEADSMWINSGTNIVVDHVSASWSVDEVLSASANIANVSVQWCYITESLNNSIHVKGAHGYGSLITPSVSGTISWHHNLYAHNQSRNPRPGTDVGATVVLDFRNNAIYNYGGRAGYGSDWDPDPERLRLNYVGNYVIAGPNSSYNYAFQGGGTNTYIYQQSNLIDLDKDLQFDGINNGWGMFSGTFVAANTPFAAPLIQTDPAAVALQRVLSFGGAMPWRRDAADQRVAGTARTHTGKIIDAVAEVGTWPLLSSQTPPADADNDGMPDYWELAMGLNPANSADRNITNSTTGYTKLEDYLNWLADPHAVCPRNGQVDVNLSTMTGSGTNLSFFLNGSVSGSAALLADGYTARFTAPPNFSGITKLSFTATDVSSGTVLPPAEVGILVTTTNANTAPVLPAISNKTAISGQTIQFTNNASDLDLPPQTIRYSLITPPGGADIGTNSGIFSWRPLVAQGGTTNVMGIVASDNGSPSLSSTQMFTVTVLKPREPQVQAIAAGAGALTLTVSGDGGPDYTILSSTNMTDWGKVFQTNTPTLPFQWSVPISTQPGPRFYNIILGP